MSGFWCLICNSFLSFKYFDLINLSVYMLSTECTEDVCLHTCSAYVSTQIDDFDYCYLTIIIPFNMNHLFNQSEVLTIAI